MRTFMFLLLSVLLAASVVSAHAQWEEKTSDWSAQGLAAGCRFITNANTDTLYYVRGTTVKTYDPSTDTWTDLNPTVGTGVFGYENWSYGGFHTSGGAAGKLVFSYGRPQVDVYDIGTNTWSKSTAPTDTFEWSWGQGNFYNPNTGEFWHFWTDNVSDGQTNETHSLVGAPYDPASDTWGDARDLRWTADYFWGRMESVNVGDINYSVDDNDYYVGRYPRMRMYDLTQTPTFPVEEPVQVTGEYDLGEGEHLVWGCYGTGAGFRGQVLAAHGTDIYVSAMQESDLFLVYHTTTGTWEQLASRPNDDPTQGCRDHSTAAFGDWIVVQDGNQFWLYNIQVIPEPGMVALLFFGAFSLFARVRRT